MKNLIVILLVVCSFSYAQSKDVEKIIKGVKDKFEKVNDYQADVLVKLNMELVKVPDSKAHVYFKQPDKFKIDSDGFAMLPKQSMNFSPTQLLKGNNTSVYVRTDKVDNILMDVVKVIPNSDTSDVILSTMWIDSKEYIIHKVETTTKRGGTVLIEFSYNKKYIPLPEQLKFSFNLGEAKVPETSQNTSKQESSFNKRIGGSMKIKGSVIMTYSNYSINKGISDKIFEEKKQK